MALSSNLKISYYFEKHIHIQFTAISDSLWKCKIIAFFYLYKISWSTSKRVIMTVIGPSALNMSFAIAIMFAIVTI